MPSVPQEYCVPILPIHRLNFTLSSKENVRETKDNDTERETYSYVHGDVHDFGSIVCVGVVYLGGMGCGSLSGRDEGECRLLIALARLRHAPRL
jgi:hypothetical protein